MTRFIDQTNILEFFETPVKVEPMVTPSSNIILKVHWGRIKASKYFFRIPESRKDRKLWEAFKAISAAYRNYLCQQLVVDKLKQDLEVNSKRTVDLGRAIEDQISKIAFSYTSLEDPRIRPEMIINGSEHINKDIRDQILLNCKL